MNKFLIIVAMVLSSSVVAIEKTWFCSTELQTGLKFNNGTWVVYTPNSERLIVKQLDDTLVFPSENFDYVFHTNCTKSKPLGDIVFHDITCDSGVGGDYFWLDTKTGTAKSASHFVDESHVSNWKCSKF